MNEQDIVGALAAAVNAVKLETPRLDFDAVNERSIAHRLAVQMERPFEDWNVDCEYNLAIGDIKNLLGIRECQDRSTDRVIPDIIVHRRQQTGCEHNLLVVEIKKNRSDDPCDRKRLELFTCPLGSYRYKTGVYINVRDGDFHNQWYKDGLAWQPSKLTRADE